MPACEYDYSENKCLGTVETLPRYIDEFLKDTQHIFTPEQILESSDDFFEFAKNRKKLAEMIVKYKISDAWILSNPHLSRIDFKFIDETLQKNHLTVSDLKDYPAIMVLFISEEQLKKFSFEFNVPILVLLKTKHQFLTSMIQNPIKVKDLLELGLSMDDVLNLKSPHLFWVEKENLKKVSSLMSLETLKNITEDSSFIFWKIDEIEKCISQDKSILPWLLKVNMYVNCKNSLEISKIFHISFSDFTTKKEDLKYLSQTALSSLKELKNLGLNLDQILKEKYPYIYDSHSINQIHQVFGVPFSEAILDSNGWANSTKVKAISYASELEQPLSYVLKMDPYLFQSEERIAALKEFKIPEKQLKYLMFGFTYKSLKLMKEALDFCAHEMGGMESMDVGETYIRKITESRVIFDQFKKDWLNYKKYFSFKNFVKKWTSDLSAIRKDLFKFYLIDGDLGELQKFSHLEEWLTVKIADDLLPLTFVSEMGYEDVFEFVKLHTPKVLRYAVKKGSYDANECGLSWNIMLNPFLPNPYYMKCNPDEPKPLLYRKEIAEFIETQGRFWTRTHFENLYLPRGASVKSALGDYKGNQYVEMGSYSSMNRNKVFPFADSNQRDVLAEKLNAINYSILLMNKLNGELVIYRSQGCENDWITKPFRLWSTTTNVDFARRWNSECILEIHIPKGYPLFFLNIASKNNNEESEFLLPGYVLSVEGKLVPAQYEIMKEEKNRHFQSIEYDSVHDIEFQYSFSSQSYIVRPASNLMHFKGNTKKEFEAYQKHYVDLLCAPEKLFTADDSLSYLRRMCEAVKQIH